MVSYAENVSIWWRHRVSKCSQKVKALLRLIYFRNHKIYYTLYNFSILQWHPYLKAFLVEKRSLFTLHSKYHGAPFINMVELQSKHGEVIVSIIKCGMKFLIHSQWLHRWSLGIDKCCHPMIYWVCDYFSMLGLKLNHVCKRGPWPLMAWWHQEPYNWLIYLESF